MHGRRCDLKKEQQGCAVVTKAQARERHPQVLLSVTSLDDLLSTADIAATQITEGIQQFGIAEDWVRVLMQLEQFSFSRWP